MAVAVSALTSAVPQWRGAQVAGRPPLDVVVLGGSCSAGNGAREASGDLAHHGPSGC
jgi:hypothetical protein